mmetsp:Transcript_11003/g.19062  ORF Transcript_11003/g.19062 Transcript_11003/m.19062 type:complete len:234 (-) Transcript_11003:1196-1897(-)
MRREVRLQLARQVIIVRTVRLGKDDLLYACTPGCQHFLLHAPNRQDAPCECDLPCHGQVRGDRLPGGKGQQGSHNGAACTGPILRRGTLWHMHVQCAAGEELAGGVLCRQKGSCKGVGDGGTLPEHVTQLACGGQCPSRFRVLHPGCLNVEGGAPHGGPCEAHDHAGRGGLVERVLGKDGLPHVGLELRLVDHDGFPCVNHLGRGRRLLLLPCGCCLLYLHCIAATATAAAAA